MPPEPTHATPDLPTGFAALDEIERGGLGHAYGPATDSPAHLQALVEGDAAARAAARVHLFSALMHQGTPWTATGPAARVVLGVLPQLADDVRGAALSFLGEVADAAAHAAHADRVAELEALAAREVGPEEGDELDDETMEVLAARAALGCLAAARLAFDPVVAQLERDASTRLDAADAACSIARATGRTAELGPLLLRHAQAADDPDQRAGLVLALAELRVSTAAFLDDAARGVRLAAALAPALDADARATEILLETLEQHTRGVDTWFRVKPPQIVGHVRYVVVWTLLRRKLPFERLQRAAVAVAGVTNKTSVDSDWGPLLSAAFPKKRPTGLDASQRAYLAALVAHEALWDPRNGNAIKWFRDARLPNDRAACAALLRG